MKSLISKLLAKLPLVRLKVLERDFGRLVAATLNATSALGNKIIELEARIEELSKKPTKKK